MATSTTARWAVAVLLCVAAATVVAAEPDTTEKLFAADFVESSMADAVVAQRSLLQARALAAPVYAPKPCALASVPNSNVYIITTTSSKGWGAGRDSFVAVTNRIYKSAAYRLNLRIAVVPRAATRCVRRNVRRVCIRFSHVYRVTVPLPRCLARKKLLRNALKAALTGTPKTRVNGIVTLALR